MLIGFLAGLLGTFAFLKKQTMLGDVVAHAALPGIVAAFMLTHSAHLMVLMSGGLIAGLCAVCLITILSRYTSLHTDTLFGIVLSVFFGIGLVLLTQVQKNPIASQSVLNKFLFGSAATLVYADLCMLLLLAGIVSTVVAILWRPFIVIIFDPDYARTVRMPVAMLQTVLQVLLVMVIVIGLYAVGVVLMSSLLVAPAVTARQLTRSVVGMAFCATICGAITCAVGMSISIMYAHVPTGAAIVVVATVGALSALVMRHGLKGIV